MKISILIENDGPCWQATSVDLKGWVAWSDSLSKLRELIVEGVEFCLESKDFIIEEHFDSSVSAQLINLLKNQCYKSNLESSAPHTYLVFL